MDFITTGEQLINVILGVMTKMARMIGSPQPWHSVLLSLGQGGAFFKITNEAFA